MSPAAETTQVEVKNFAWNADLLVDHEPAFGHGMIPFVESTGGKGRNGVRCLTARMATLIPVNF
jgi:hypothetical protein